MVRYRCRYDLCLWFSPLESRSLSSLFTLAADLVMHQRRVWVLPNFLSHVTQWRMTLLFHIGGIHLEASRTQTGPLCSLVAGLKSHVCPSCWISPAQRVIQPQEVTALESKHTYSLLLNLSVCNPWSDKHPESQRSVQHAWQEVNSRFIPRFTHDPTNRAEGKSAVSPMWCWIKRFDRENRLYQKL